MAPQDKAQKKDAQQKDDKKSNPKKSTASKSASTTKKKQINFFLGKTPVNLMLSRSFAFKMTVKIRFLFILIEKSWCH